MTKIQSTSGGSNVLELFTNSSILEFGIYPSTELRVVSPSTLLRTVSLSNGLSNHLLFGYCNLPARHLFGGVLGIFSIQGLNDTYKSNTAYLTNF
jgi:hypothetical protein